MSNIHKLTDTPLPGEVNDDLVEALEGLIKRAKQGEIQAIAWAGWTNAESDTLFTGWDGAGGTSFHLGAAVGALNTRYMLGLTE